MKRYHIIVEGRVQGVGFRYFCVTLAKERELTGSVKNLLNGMVEIYVQGESEKIDSFLSAIQKGNFLIRVDNMSLKRSEVIEDEKDFTYLIY